jgi:hypothetical protein
MKTVAVVGVVVVLALALGWMYEFRPVPTWWVDLRINSLGVGRIEAMKTNGGFFMTGEGEVYFRDPLNHEAQGAFTGVSRSWFSQCSASLRKRFGYKQSWLIVAAVRTKKLATLVASGPFRLKRKPNGFQRMRFLE